MKKLLYCAAALATLLFAGSCQRENLEPAVEGATVSYTVKVPGAVTKADGEDYSGAVNQLVYEVHRVNEDETSVRLYQKTAEITGGVANVDIEVVKDQNFTILFWAQKSGVAFDTESLKAVKMPATFTANVEDYEAFYGVDEFTYTTDITATNTVELTRAVSMLNIGTTAASLNVGGQAGNVSLIDSGVSLELPSTLNIMSGESTEYAPATYAANTVPSGKLTVGDDEYVYVAKNYVGFAEAGKSTVDVTLTIVTNEGTITHQIPSVPFQRNYKTNIVGDLITASASYTVTLTDTWAGEEVVEIWDGETLSAPEIKEDATTGTQYVEVTSGSELAWLANAVNGTLPEVRSSAVDYSKQTIVLTGNVNLGGHEWTPIGVGSKHFQGTFDGNGYSIENFIISEKHGGKPQAALFGTVSGDPTFRNVTIAGAKVVYPGEGDFYGAGLIGTAYGNLNIENVTVKNCEISGNNKVAGLLAHDGGSSSWKIKNCHVEGCKIESLNEEDGGNVGGLVGLYNSKATATIESSSVKNCTINGLNPFNSGKRSNGEFVGCVGNAGVLSIMQCEVSGNTFTQNEGVTYVSPYGVFVGGDREDKRTATVIVDGVQMIDNGFTKNGNTFEVSNAAHFLAAANMLADGDVIKLLADVTFDKDNRSDNGGWWDGLAYSGDKSFTIDLGGYTITQDGSLNDYLIWVKNDGAKANTITLKNGTMDAGKTAYSAFATASSNTQTITVNLENINLVNNISNGAVVKARGGSVLNVNAGTVITGKNSYVGIEAVGNNTVVNVYDGAKIYQNGTSSTVGAIIGASYNATLNIYGGEGKSAKCGIIVMSTGARINVSGGEWTANGDGTVAGGNQAVLASQNNRNEKGWACKSVINVTGGTFKGGFDCWGMGPGQEADDAQINISGGNFNANPTRFLTEGYRAVEKDGVWTVSEVLPAAMIGEVKYETLAAAIAAVQEGETVKVCSEISEGSIKLPATLKNVTIKGEAECLLKDMTISAADGNAYNYQNLTFDGLTFDNSRLLFTGWRNGEEVIENLTVTNCTFKNLDDDTNTAPVHINKDAVEAVNGFTFTNNVIDGATGGSKSGVYAQVTGNVVFTDNVINNVSFRPYVIQVTTDDGIADSFVVTGNTFSGSSVGRAQGLGSNDAGTDQVNLKVSQNIFKDITGAQQICYWNFNAEKTTAVLSHNYYDIDIAANPSRIYYNKAASSVEDLVEMGVYPIYEELNADGTINTNSLYNPSQE